MTNMVENETVEMLLDLTTWQFLVTHLASPVLKVIREIVKSLGIQKCVTKRPKMEINIIYTFENLTESGTMVAQGGNKNQGVTGQVEVCLLSEKK